MEKAKIKIMNNKKRIKDLKLLQQNAKIKHLDFIHKSIQQEFQSTSI